MQLRLNDEVVAGPAVGPAMEDLVIPQVLEVLVQQLRQLPQLLVQQLQLGLLLQVQAQAQAPVVDLLFQPSMARQQRLC